MLIYFIYLFIYYHYYYYFQILHNFFLSNKFYKKTDFKEGMQSYRLFYLKYKNTSQNRTKDSEKERRKKRKEKITHCTH